MMLYSSLILRLYVYPVNKNNSFQFYQTKSKSMIFKSNSCNIWYNQGNFFETNNFQKGG